MLAEVDVAARLSSRVAVIEPNGAGKSVSWRSWGLDAVGGVGKSGCGSAAQQQVGSDWAERGRQVGELGLMGVDAVGGECWQVCIWQHASAAGIWGLHER